jgi:integrase
MEMANARIQTAGKATTTVQPPSFNPKTPEAGQIQGPPKLPLIVQIPSPAHSADVRQLITSKEYSATGAMKVQWQKAISEMTAVIKTKHYSVKTLKSYGYWVWKFQSYRKDTDPALLGSEDVKTFLTWLAVSCNVSASSQNQAFNAILFFFRHVLKKDFGEIRDVVRAKRKPYIPVVLSRDEVATVIKYLYPPYNLIVKTMYSCGLRLFECIKRNSFGSGSFHKRL